MKKFSFKVVTDSIRDWSLGMHTVATEVTLTISTREASSKIAAQLGMEINLETPDGPMIGWVPAMLRGSIARASGFAWDEMKKAPTPERIAEVQELVNAWLSTQTATAGLWALQCTGQKSMGGEMNDAWVIVLIRVEGATADDIPDVMAALAEDTDRKVEQWSRQIGMGAAPSRTAII